MFIDKVINRRTKDKNLNDIKTRSGLLIFSSIFGIVTNFILLTIKLVIGLLINSVSVIANAIDSLSDFSTNFLALISFKMSAKPADKNHPYGHQRLEYVEGLMISLIITFIGFTLLLSSIKNIINYESFIITKTMFITSISILTISIIIKFYQFLVYKKLSLKLNSSALKDTSVDSLSDIFTNLILIVGLIINYICLINNYNLPFSLDGVLGLIESIIIIISGIRLIKGEIDNLIGVPVKKEYVKEIEEFINSYPLVLGTHDALCHKYGENICYMTIHVEVDEESRFKDIDQYSEKIENDVLNKFNVNLTIHLDPVSLENQEVKELENNVFQVLNDISNEITFHDFRLKTENNKNIITFDILLPFNLENKKEQIIEMINKKISPNHEFEIHINFDHSFEN